MQFEGPQKPTLSSGHELSPRVSPGRPLASGVEYLISGVLQKPLRIEVPKAIHGYPEIEEPSSVSAVLLPSLVKQVSALRPGAIIVEYGYGAGTYGALALCLRNDIAYLGIDRNPIAVNAAWRNFKQAERILHRSEFLVADIREERRTFPADLIVADLLPPEGKPFVVEELQQTFNAVLDSTRDALRPGGTALFTYSSALSRTSLQDALQSRGFGYSVEQTIDTEHRIGDASQFAVAAAVVAKRL